MALPHVQVVLEAGGSGKVIVDGVELPGVTAVQIQGSVRELPQVLVTLLPNQVVADLPQAVITALLPGPNASEFVEQLNPARLEGLALQQHEQSTAELTMGEAFAAAATLMADEFEQIRRG